MPPGALHWINPPATLTHVIMYSLPPFSPVSSNALHTHTPPLVSFILVPHNARYTCVPSLYDALIGFYGDEFYFKEWPELEGKTFKEILFSFHSAIPIGMVTEEGEIKLNPGDDEVLEKGCALIVIAEDELSYAPDPSGKPLVDTSDLLAMTAGVRSTSRRRSAAGGYGGGGFANERYTRSKIPHAVSSTRPEDILIVGWRRDVDDIIALLDCVVQPGSSVHLLNEVPIKEREARLMSGGLDVTLLENITLGHFLGNSMSRQTIQTIQVNTFDSVLILADQAFEADTLHCDSHSLASLLMIRDQLSRQNTGCNQARGLTNRSSYREVRTCTPAHKYTCTPR